MVPWYLTCIAEFILTTTLEQAPLYPPLRTRTPRADLTEAT